MIDPSNPYSTQENHDNVMSILNKFKNNGEGDTYWTRKVVYLSGMMLSLQAVSDKHTRDNLLNLITSDITAEIRFHYPDEKVEDRVNKMIAESSNLIDDMSSSVKRRDGKPD